MSSEMPAPGIFAIRKQDLLNAPNIISLGRIIVIPAILVAFWSGLGMLALLLTLGALISDFFDGYIARKYKLITTLGEILDPIGDKALTIALIFLFVSKGLLPLWWVAFSLIYEIILLSGAALIFYKNLHAPLVANLSGKISRFIQSIVLGGVAILLFTGIESFWIDKIVLISLYLHLFAALFALYTYGLRFYQSQQAVTD